MDSSSNHHTFWEGCFLAAMHVCHSVSEFAALSEEAEVLFVDDFKVG